MWQRTFALRGGGRAISDRTELRPPRAGVFERGNPHLDRRRMSGGQWCALCTAWKSIIDCTCSHQRPNEDSMAVTDAATVASTDRPIRRGASADLTATHAEYIVP